MFSLEAREHATAQGTIRYWANAARADSKPTLVFLPGLTATHQLFKPQIARFSRDYRCITWDAPCHGISRPFDVQAFTLPNLANWLHEIVSQEKAAKPVIVGQSLGGYIGQMYAQLFPHELAGFVSIDSAPLQAHYYPRWEVWLLKHMLLMYKSIPWNTLIRWGSRGCATTAAGQKLMADMMDSYEKHEYCALAARGYRALAEAIEADLPYHLDCPALLMCGTQDHAGDVIPFNKKWTAHTDIPLVWIEGAGHNSNFDAPDAVNTHLETFLTSLH